MPKNEQSAAEPPMPPLPKAPAHRSIEEAFSEVEREMQVRERMYGKWIQDGKISRVDAKDRGERMQAACHYLKLLNNLSEEQQRKFLDGDSIPF